MIIRLLRYRLVPGARAAFEASVRSEGLPRLAGLAALRFALVGHGSGDEGIVVTAWHTFEGIAESIGGDLDRPVIVAAPAAELIAARQATHFEALDLPAIGSGRPAILRLMVGEVPGAGESAYFEWVRTCLWPSIALSDGLTGAWLGRQAGDGGSDPVAGITTWTSRAAIAAARVDSGPFAVDGDTGPFRSGEVELFDLFGLVPEDRETAAG